MLRYQLALVLLAFVCCVATATTTTNRPRKVSKCVFVFFCFVLFFFSFFHLFFVYCADSKFAKGMFANATGRDWWFNRGGLECDAGGGTGSASLRKSAIYWAKTTFGAFRCFTTKNCKNRRIMYKQQKCKMKNVLIKKI